MFWKGKRFSRRAKRRSLGRAVMLVGLVLAALLWSGALGPLSAAVWRLDERLKDLVSMMASAPSERDDLVFLGIDEECRLQENVDPEVRAASRALTLMREAGGNEHLDRRVFAEVVDRLTAAGAGLVIFDILFVGSSGSVEADREFAGALRSHHERIMLSQFFRSLPDGRYEPVSSREQLPGIATDRHHWPHEGYVNFRSDADGVVRHMMYRTTLEELRSGERREGDPLFESLAAATGRLLGVDPPALHQPRLRFAVGTVPGADDSVEPSFAGAYAPRSLHTIFVPTEWSGTYQDGAYFRDKVVLISTSTNRDEDYHPIPGAVVYGGQFHLQALDALLADRFWRPAPAWVEMLTLLGMAAVALLLGLPLRHPVALLLASIALGGGLVVVCTWLSGLTGVLFAGTPGLLALVMVTLFAELGYLAVRTAERSDSA